MSPRFLELDDLIELAELLVGSPAPVRDVGLLGAAAARPQTSVFGDYAYPDLHQQAAALLHSIVTNHPLVDGNKRLGWLATAVFLEINDVVVTGIANDDVYDLVYTVAASDIDVAEMAAALEQLVADSGAGPQSDR